MIYGGIDAGIEYVKAVVIKDGAVISRAVGLSRGFGLKQAAAEVWEKALEAAGVKAEEVAAVYATGKGKYDVGFADDIYSEPVCAAAAAKFMDPEATEVVDAGADETLVVALGGKSSSGVAEMVINQKCSAGVGFFLETMADRLGLTIEQMSAVPAGDPEAAVSDGCVVFAWLDALSLLNKGVPVEKVAAAATECAAVRSATAVNDLTFPNTEKTLLVGGLTLNAAYVKALTAHTGVEFVIPTDALYAGAIGAALMAAKNSGQAADGARKGVV